MMNDTGKFNIHHEIFSCEGVYEPENALMNLKTHDYIEICMIVAGNGIHLVLDQAIPCKEGDVFVTPPNIPHRYLLESKNETLTVRQLRFNIENWFDGDIATADNSRYCYGIFKDNSITAYAMLNSFMRDKIASIYDTIEAEIFEKKNEWQDAVRSCLSQLLINFGRYIDNSIKNATSASSKEWNTALTVIRIVKDNYCDCGLTLESIADKLYLSKSTLSKTFKKLTGKQFSEYLRELRLNEACRLLKESDLNINEIVIACGLRDVPTFYKNFNSFMNMSPSEYRQATSLPESPSVKQINEEHMETVLSDISENLQKGKAKIVKELVLKALDAGFDPEQILNEGLLSGMRIISEKFKNAEIYVTEVLVASKAMNMGAQTLKPHLSSRSISSIGRVCLGTVQGDLHDIGKNLVKMMLESKSIEVIDLGTDVAPEVFVKTAIEQNCQVICCSALLTTTMPVMADVVKQAELAGIRDKVKIMIGGAPITKEFCRSIGADCYTSDAASAADMAAEFCKALNK